MMPEMLLPLLIGIIGAAIGGLLVWMYYYLQSGTQGGKARSSPDAQQDETDHFELLSVSRNKANEPVIFVQGQPHRHLWEIKDLQTSRETIQAIKAVLDFANIDPDKTSKASAARPANVQPEPSRPMPVKAPAAVQNPKASGAEQPNIEAEDVGPPSKERLSMLNRPGQMLEPLQFVEDIERRFQEKIANRPDLLERRIHVTVAPSGGIRIYMDQHYFDAVGDITDPEIKALIQEAIHEWERS